MCVNDLRACQITEMLRTNHHIYRHHRHTLAYENHYPCYHITMHELSFQMNDRPSNQIRQLLESRITMQKKKQSQLSSSNAVNAFHSIPINSKRSIFHCLLFSAMKGRVPGSPSETRGFKLEYC